MRHSTETPRWPLQELSVPGVSLCLYWRPRNPEGGKAGRGKHCSCCFRGDPARARGKELPRTSLWFRDLIPARARGWAEDLLQACPSIRITGAWASGPFRGEAGNNARTREAAPDRKRRSRGKPSLGATPRRPPARRVCLTCDPRVAETVALPSRVCVSGTAMLRLGHALLGHPPPHNPAYRYHAHILSRARPDQPQLQRFMQPRCTLPQACAQALRPC